LPIFNPYNFFSKNTMNSTHPAKVSLLLKGLLLAGLASTLVACGGDDAAPAAPIQAASANLTAPVNNTSVGALLPQAGTAAPVFVFPNGFSGVDAAGAPVSITGSTTVAFSGTSAAPAFAVTNGGSTASGTMSFGSCILTITTSVFPSVSAFATGKTFKVDPCTVTVNAQGVAVNTVTSRSVTVTYGNAFSNAINVPVTVGTNGAVVIGNVTLGTVTLVTPTGGG
jgi:hypothetical protein